MLDSLKREVSRIYNVLFDIISFLFIWVVDFETARESV